MGFSLVSVIGDNYEFDSDEYKTDTEVLKGRDIKKLLNYGVILGGVSLANNGNINVLDPSCIDYDIPPRCLCSIKSEDGRIFDVSVTKFCSVYVKMDESGSLDILDNGDGTTVHLTSHQDITFDLNIDSKKSDILEAVNKYVESEANFDDKIEVDDSDVWEYEDEEYDDDYDESEEYDDEYDEPDEEDWGDDDDLDDEEDDYDEDDNLDDEEDDYDEDDYYDEDDDLVEDWEDVIDGLTLIEDGLYKIEYDDGSEKLINLPPYNGGVFITPEAKYYGSLKARDVETEEEDDDSESSESVLFSRLSPEQVKLIQLYYLYTSEYIFKLERGTVELDKRKKSDIDALKGNANDTWNYIGFVDMGYAGAAVCPHCNMKQRYNAVSECCGYPIFNTGLVRDSLGKKIPMLNDDGTIKRNASGDRIIYQKGLIRSYSGTCIKCGKRCGVVTSDMIGRKVNRGNMQGVVCAMCGNKLTENSHYSDFHNPTRYLHLGWNVSKSDAKEQFWGRIVNTNIEAVIENEACVKFGIGDIADFFGIDKKSEAYKTLYNIGVNCRKDIKELTELYSTLDDFTEYNESFAILDEFAPKLIALNAKLMFLKKDATLPTKLLSLYMDMRKEGILIPRSLIQFIRDFVIKWDTHKFISNPENESTARIGRLGGSCRGLDKIGEKEIHTRVKDLIIGLCGMRGNTLYHYVDPDDILQQEDVNFKVNVSRFFRSYVTDLLVYQLCGYYKYNAKAGEYRDEGGAGEKHEQELSTFMHYKDYTFKDFSYSIEFLKKVCTYADKMLQLTTLLSTVKTNFYRRTEGIKRLFYTPYFISDSEGMITYDEDGHYDEDNIKQFDDKLPMYIATVNQFLSGRDKHRYTIDEYLEEFDTSFTYVTTKLAEFPIYLENRLKALNEEKLREKEKERERREAEEKRKETERKEREEAEKRSVEEEKTAYANYEREHESEAYLSKEMLEQELNKYKPAKVANTEPKTTKELVDYLSKADLSKVGNSYDFHKSILETVKKHNSEMTDKQLYRLKQLYEKVSGKEYKGSGVVITKKRLSDIPDLKVKLEYINDHKDLVSDDFTYTIVQSVLKYGTISEKQQKYIDSAVKIYEEARNG